MLPYILLIIIVLPLFWVDTHKKENNVFLVIWFAVAILLFGLHGDFTADFNSYKRFFMEYSTYDMKEILSILNINYHFQVLEIGYVVINYVCSLFFDSFLSVQICAAMIVCIPIMMLLKKSVMPVLSIALFISIGPYLEGFNTMRNIMAASITILAMKYVYSKQFYKYCLVILCASLIHLSALIMIPFYFILNLNVNWKTIIKYILGIIIVTIFMDTLAVWYNKIFLISSKSTSIIELLYRNKAELKHLLPAILLATISISLALIIWKKEKRGEYRIIINGTIIWLVLKILMLYTGYATRFAAYFSYHIYLLLPLVLQRIHPMKCRKIMMGGICIGCFVFYLILTKAYGPYYICKF